jgi:hypothetical protein
MNAGRLFVKVVFILVTLVLLIGQAQAQDEPKICISRDAAESCATNAAKVTALEAHILTLEQALKDERKIVQDLRVEVARYSGRIESCEKNDASNRAIITAMIPLLRRKSIGLITF